MFLYILILTMFLGGCAPRGQYGSLLDNPEVSALLVSPQVMPIKDTSQNRLREGTLLVANRSPVWRDGLFFSGCRRKEDILTFDENGYMVLALSPIGSFSLGPADRPENPYPQYRTKLMAGFYSGQEYTVLVFSKDMADRMVGPPQICTGRIATEPASRVYTYIPYLGTMAGQYVREAVNDVVYLPDRNPREYRGTNTLNMTIDVNMLLQRGIHKIRNP